MPGVNLFNGDTGYLQHDLKLTSLNTFALDMVEHDNSPKPTAFTAKWSQSNGQILLNGTMAKVTAVISTILLSVTVVAIPSLIVNVMVPGTSWSATKATIMEIFGLQRSSPIQLNT